MLFNSLEFLFLFLPVALAGYYIVRRRSPDAAIAFLAAASLVFYAAWDWRYAPLLAASVLFNYALGHALAVRRRRPGGMGLLVFGVGANLALLGWFKYANFLVDSLNEATGSGIALATIVLPIGISFFTFQQIAFLVDARRGLVRETSLSRYALFVTFFPQLIAGPIVHHGEMMGQFGRPRRSRAEDLAAGLTLLCIGLVKKVAIADHFAIPASGVFDAAAGGYQPNLVEAWTGALCYTLQIYFDFSAYSDMALGLARMFGIDLPINFFSPYKATSIIEFWQRWHITLSRFLRDYLYVPLGGSRRGPVRRYANIAVTMVLGGLWHGAGWTFLLWGAMHGALLMLNHLWRHTAPGRALRGRAAWRPAAFLLTMISIVFAWVLFRAADMDAAMAVWRGMVGANGLVLPDWATVALDLPASDRPLQFLTAALPFEIAAAILVCVAAPNAIQLMRRARIGLASPGYESILKADTHWPRWRVSVPYAALTACALALVVLQLNDISAFIYFQF